MNMDFFRKLDPILLLSTLILVGFGIVMVYSASFAVADERMGDPYFFLKKQAIAAGLGIILLVLAARINYHLWQMLSLPLLLASPFPAPAPGQRGSPGGPHPSGDAP